MTDRVNTQDCRIWSTDNPYEIVHESKRSILLYGSTTDLLQEKQNVQTVSVTIMGERYHNKHNDIENMIIFM